MVSAIERSWKARMANIVHSMSVAIFALFAGCVASPVEPIDSAGGDADAIEISTEPGDPTGEAQHPVTLVSFSPSDFPFVTTIKDDGTGEGGGWQVAKANLSFWKAVIPRGIKRWKCPLTIQMPLRTKYFGRVPPSRAATLSVEITEDVARGMEKDYGLPQGIFCEKFRSQTLGLFKLRYPNLGASVTL
jgi:hypothetical protein